MTEVEPAEADDIPRTFRMTREGYQRLLWLSFSRRSRCAIMSSCYVPRPESTQLMHCSARWLMRTYDCKLALALDFWEGVAENMPE
jgi:hypothetical protein